MHRIKVLEHIPIAFVGADKGDDRTDLPSGKPKWTSEPEVTYLPNEDGLGGVLVIEGEAEYPEESKAAKFHVVSGSASRAEETHVKKSQDRKKAAGRPSKPVLDIKTGLPVGDHPEGMPGNVDKTSDVGAVAMDPATGEDNTGILPGSGREIQPGEKFNEGPKLKATAETPNPLAANQPGITEPVMISNPNDGGVPKPVVPKNPVTPGNNPNVAAIDPKPSDEGRTLLKGSNSLESGQQPKIIDPKASQGKQPMTAADKHSPTPTNPEAGFYPKGGGQMGQVPGAQTDPNPVTTNTVPLDKANTNPDVVDSRSSEKKTPTKK